MPELRVAIVGCGLMGRWHAEAARRCGARIVACVDPRAEAARRLARRFPGAVTAARIEELPADARLEAVHVCVPTLQHPPLVRAALTRDAHVLVEKPLCGSAAETQALLAEGEARDRLVLPVHQLLFQRGFRAACARLPALQPLAAIELTVATAGGAGHEPAELDALVADILPHPLSLLLRLEPRAGSGAVGVEAPRPGELGVSLRVVDGPLLRFAISTGARPPELSAVIRGAGGTLRLDLFHGFVRAAGPDASRAGKILRPFTGALRELKVASLNLAGRALRREAAYPGLRELVSAFYGTVVGGGAWPIPRQEIVEVARLRDRILDERRRYPAATG